MNIKYFLVLFLVDLIYFICADDVQNCLLQKYFRVCKKSGKLVIVKKLPSTHTTTNWLRISDSEINSIDQDTFKDLSITHLALNLSNSKLELVTESFNGVPSLTDLKFDSGIVKLQENLFQAVKNISSLGIIIDGQNQTFENGLLELKKLIRLNIHDSNLGEINSKTFLNIQPRIRQVILQRNNITSIEQTAFNNLENLTTLTFISNNIDALQSGVFDGLKKLRVLIINAENLTSISKNVFNTIEKLQELDLNSNKIRSIQRNAFKGSNITWLQLDNNALNNLDYESFNGLNELAHLSLRKNNIESIPKNVFTRLNKLIKLDLSHNKIYQIQSAAFSKMNSKLELDLSYNKFAIINSQGFQDIQIDLLDLSHNDFNKIEDGSFKNSVIKKFYLPILNNHIGKELKIKWGLNDSTRIF